MVPDWVYDGSARRWIPADKSSFIWDQASGYWLSPKYYYNPRTGWYTTVAGTSALGQDKLLTAPAVVHTAFGDLKVGSASWEAAKMMGLIDASGRPTGAAGASVFGTGGGSSNSALASNGNQSWFDLTGLVNVINTLQSAARSGNASADANTHVGDAVTGAASVIANLVNLLVSAWSWSNGDLSFFMQTIGNYNHDITLTPTASVAGGGGSLGSDASAGNTGAGSSNIAGAANSSSLNVNAKNAGNIVNDVDLNARSGDASATRNTTAGDVKTGDAFAEVNIINLINSFINSGNSFFGILNIMGSLNGDILFPDGFLNNLLASGSGTGGANGGSASNGGRATINNSVYNGVNNAIQTTAASGSAGADANTSVGNVRTGSAATTQGLFNLANTSIFGDNAVLVIVNVLGHWVGKIMNLPGSGASQSALLTGNAQVGANTTGSGSGNSASIANANDATINQTSVGTITNNVKVNAQSGDATASKNTAVGDVTSGNAKAASSVANIFNTVLNVKHWFGVLVINVFGDWVGDVNHDSAAGDTSTSGSQGGGAWAAVASATSPRVGLLAVFVGKSTGSKGTSAAAGSGQGTGGATGGQAQVNGGGKVLTAAAEQPVSQKLAAAAKGKDMSILFALSAGVMLLAGALAAIDRKLKPRPASVRKPEKPVQ